MLTSALHVGQGSPTFAYSSQDAYQVSTISCLPVELLVQIISLALPEKSSCNLALVCRHWQQIIYTIHPFHLLKQQRFASPLEGFYLYSHVENKEQVDKINQVLKGWLPTFIANCRNARQAAFTLENMWLPAFNTHISSPNQELTNALAILRQLQISNYIPQIHLKMILRSHAIISFSNRLLTTAIQIGCLSLIHIPQNLRCYALYLAAIQQNGCILRYVPKELRTPDICLAAVQQYGLALEHVPKELRTPDICLVAVQQQGRALVYVPKELKTPAICLAAVQQDARAFEETLQVLQKELLSQRSALEQKGLSALTKETYLTILQWILVALQWILAAFRWILAAFQQVCRRQ